MVEELHLMHHVVQLLMGFYYEVIYIHLDVLMNHVMI